MADHIAFLGLGGMGTAISTTLINGGKLTSELLIWNRTQSKVDSLMASMPGKARHVELSNISSSANIIWSILKDDKAVHEVYETLLKSDITGKLLIDSSSIPGSVSNQLGEKVKERGGVFLSMPVKGSLVFGDPSVASMGKLIVVPAGPRQGIERIRPYLNGVVAKAVIELPDHQQSDASTIKLIGNTLILNSMNAIAEALVFADKAGVGSESMGELIGSLFPLPPHAIYLKKMLSGEYYSGEPAVPVPMASALAKVVLDLADRSGVSVPAYQVAVNHLAACQNDHAEIGSHTMDITSMYGAVRVKNGLPFKKE